MDSLLARVRIAAHIAVDVTVLVGLAKHNGSERGQPGWSLRNTCFNSILSRLQVTVRLIQTDCLYDAQNPHIT